MSGPDPNDEAHRADGTPRATRRGPDADHPDAETGPPADDRAPLFGRWSVWYVLVAFDLLLVILICAWITHRHP